jgi:hypothetical protein
MPCCRICYLHAANTGRPSAEESGQAGGGNGIGCGMSNLVATVPRIDKLPSPPIPPHAWILLPSTCRVLAHSIRNFWQGGAVGLDEWETKISMDLLRRFVAVQLFGYFWLEKSDTSL